MNYAAKLSKILFQYTKCLMSTLLQIIKSSLSDQTHRQWESNSFNKKSLNKH